MWRALFIDIGIAGVVFDIDMEALHDREGSGTGISTISSFISAPRNQCISVFSNRDGSLMSFRSAGRDMLVIGFSVEFLTYTHSIAWFSQLS